MHKQLDAYRIAVDNFEKAAQAMLTRLEQVRLAAGALPVPVLTDGMQDAMRSIASSVNLGLSAHYRSTVVPMVKASEGE